MGMVKSAMGIGGLLCMGIGDTIRVTLTADPVEEIYAAKKILRAAGLRQEGVKTPIMMLTAKGQKSDRITGFNAGADDYLPKPFDPDELLSRVRAILRRSEAYQPTVLAYGDLTLDPGSGNLSCGSESIRLSGREFQIMELFMRSPRQVFSAERIMERVWGWDNEAEINVVWVNISNLRKKLKSIGSHVTLQANRGLGYVLEESV